MHRGTSFPSCSRVDRTLAVVAAADGDGGARCDAVGAAGHCSRVPTVVVPVVAPARSIPAACAAVAFVVGAADSGDGGGDDASGRRYWQARPHVGCRCPTWRSARRNPCVVARTLVP